MNTIIEDYIPANVTSQAQIDTARKQFKAELRNGPTKSVYYANGISGEKAFGNFDLLLFHKAYDVDLAAAGALVYFDTDGLLKDRHCYGDLKQIPGEAGKFSKELWVLQFGQSDYKLINAAKRPEPLTPEVMFSKLKEDKELEVLLHRSFNAKFVSANDLRATINISTLEELFNKMLKDVEAFRTFLSATYLSRENYDTIRINIISLFTVIAASDLLVRSIQSVVYKTKEDKLLKAEPQLGIFYNEMSSAGLRINLVFKDPAEINNPKAEDSCVVIVPRYKQKPGDRLLDMPVYVNASNGGPRRIDTQIPSIQKMSDITKNTLEFAVLEIKR